MRCLSELGQEIGKADFVAALELAAEQQMYGAEYVRAIVTLPVASVPNSTTELHLSALLPCAPTQQEVERDLAHSDQ